jgi:hypothetical protein
MTMLRKDENARTETARYGLRKDQRAPLTKLTRRGFIMKGASLLLQASFCIVDT